MNRPAALDVAYEQLKKLEQQQEALRRALGKHAPPESGKSYVEREAERKRKFAAGRNLEKNAVTIRQRTPEWQEKWERYRYDLKAFLTECFPATTSKKPFGEQQLRAIDITQDILLNGGRFCDAEPRGFVKSSRTANSAIWAIIYGHRKCITIFAANMINAADLLAIVRQSIMGNDLLAELTPFSIDCFRAIEANPHRATYQHCNGKPTGLVWKSNVIRFPTLPEADAFGGSITIRPLTSARGQVLSNRVTGDVDRPDFIFLDDIQKDEVALSESRVSKLVSLIKTGALRLSGHSKTLSAVMTITCQRPGDVADYFLTDKSWIGVRNKMLIHRATNEKEFWLGPYAEARRNFEFGDKEGMNAAHLAATQLYLENREFADEGCVPGWDWAYAWEDEPQHEFSAIQHAYNILIDDGESVFAAECQNEPSVAGDGEKKNLTIRFIKAKKSHTERRVVPGYCRKVVAGIDVQERAIFWVVMGLGDGMTGTVIDYGVYPEQSTFDFQYENIVHNLVTVYPDDQPSGRIYNGLQEVTSRLLAREWIREDGTVLPMNKMMIDRGYETDAVDFFIKTSPFKGSLLGSMGFGVAAKDLPFASRQKQEHDQRGDNWIIRPIANDKNQRIGRMLYCMIDTNFWKSQMRNGFLLGPGNKGCLSLYNSPHEDWHLGISRHLCAEYAIETAGRGRVLDEWKVRPGSPDNHWLDCIVMGLVAGSIEGIDRVHSAYKVKPKVTARYVTLK